MRKLAVVRDIHLNLWDTGNYAGVPDRDTQLVMCGRGMGVPWDSLVGTYPHIEFFKYDNVWEVLELDPDIVDVPDAHYPFSQSLVKRFDKTIIASWDNLPGKNTFDEAALAALDGAYKHVARSLNAMASLVWDGVPYDQIRIIPGAVDTNFFVPPFTHPRLEDVILYVGRFAAEKGLLTLIQAMKGVPGTKLWIAGEGSGEEKEELARWVEKAGITTAWLGFVDRLKLAKIMRQATALCVPSAPKLTYNPHSTWIEQFGQVLIEGMASGMPIIGAMSGAIPEVVGEGGVYFPPGDFLTLEGAIHEVVSSQGHSGELGRSARSRAAALYDQDVVGKLIRDWYFGGVK